MFSKTDYAIAALVGFLVGVFAIPTVYNLGFREPLILLLLPLVIPPLWVFGVWLGNLLSKQLPFTIQFSKFVVVGFLNTAIDFGVLNILSAFTGITAGFFVGGVNVPGFSIAFFNSYFWNKLWVFKDREEENIFHDLPRFLAVTLVGLLINSSIVVAVTTYLVPFGGFSPTQWLNLAKVSATVISLVWNFLGYKFLVFGDQSRN